MKKIVGLVMILVLLLGSGVGLAEGRSEHQKTLLRILSDMSCKHSNEEGIFEEAYYHEEKDIYVLTYEQPMTKKEFDELVLYGDNFLKKSSDLCKKELCNYYMNWMETFNIDIDVVIRHISTDGHFLYCMVNGVLSETDALNLDFEKEKTIQDSMLVLFSLMECDTEEEFFLECAYNYQDAELKYIYILNDYSKEQFEGSYGEEMKRNFAKSIQENVCPKIEKRLKESMAGAKEAAEKYGIEFQYDRSQFDIIVTFQTKNEEDIVTIKNGKIIE